jgi:hypothetical protein
LAKVTSRRRQQGLLTLVKRGRRGGRATRTAYALTASKKGSAT